MSKRSGINRPMQGLLLLILLLAVSACNIEETPAPPETITLHEGAMTTPGHGVALPFETILQEKIVAIPDGWSEVELFEDEEPALFVVARPEEIADVERWIFPEPLSTLDYQQEFALVVFQGYKGYFNYGVTIEHVLREGRNVNICVEFPTPTPHMEKKPMSSSPYHVIRIPKQRVWGQEITFNLIVNDETILSVTHYIP